MAFFVFGFYVDAFAQSTRVYFTSEIKGFQFYSRNNPKECNGYYQDTGYNGGLGTGYTYIMNSGSGSGPGVQRACATIANNLHLGGKCGVRKPTYTSQCPVITSTFSGPNVGSIPNLTPTTERHFFCTAWESCTYATGSGAQYLDGHVVCPKNWTLDKRNSNKINDCYITESHLNNVASADKCPETVNRDGRLYPYDAKTKRCLISNPPTNPCNPYNETWDGSFCKPKKPDCPNHQFVNESNNCQDKCRGYEIWNGSKCAKRPPNCQAGSILQNGMCVPEEKNGNCDQPD
jgi:hypothetical protein